MSPVTRRTDFRCIGRMRFMCFKGGLNVALFIAFLKRLIEPSRVSRGQGPEMLGANKARIALFLLPAYAPGHDPDEYLNNDLKQKLNSNRPRIHGITTIDGRSTATESPKSRY
jgi:hypothetical protein